jgi:CheY-like chemotaxis protein
VFAIMLVGLSADMRSQVADYIRIKMENLDLAEKYRKAATAAEKANRDKTRFLASASHDLRQPLHAMGLHLATLQQQAAAWPADAQQTITHIEGTLESATRLFNGVLDVSLLETGRLTVRQSVFALQPFLQGIQQDLAPLAQLAHMNIVIPPAGESLMVRSDAILLRRMIQNLMSNSIRHSGGTHVQIDTVALPQDAPQHVVLRVWDNGRGLPDRVWDDMAASSSASSASSASAAACRLTAGSHVVGATDNLGLGLAIVRQMADALGVDITPIPMVAPQPASGLCIEIGRLPVDHATVTAPDPAAGQCAPCHAQVTAPFPILVIENDAEARTGLVAVLRSWGYDPVAICGQADTRVHQVNPADFRVILCDVHLHDGVFAPVWLRDMWLGDIPVDKCPAVVVMSGMPVDAVPPDITAYAHVIMQKPVRPVQLRSVLLRYQSVAS